MSHCVPVRVLLLLLALSVVPAVAHADSFIYTVNSPISKVLTQFSFIQPTIASSGDVTSGFTQISGSTATEFAWNSDGPCTFGGGKSFGAAGSGCGVIGLAGQSFLLLDFDPGSFLAPGTYANSDLGLVTVNIAQMGVPEPSSLLLLGSGILGLFGAVRRKLA